MNRFASKEEEKLYYEHEASEEDFLNWYQKQERPEYDKPSLTVDIVLMCYNKEEDQLKVLLIQRKGHPYRNSWALPGGFVQKDESTGESVLRETKKTLNNCIHSARLIEIRAVGSSQSAT